MTDSYLFLQIISGFFCFLLFARLRYLRKAIFHDELDLWEDVPYFSLHRRKYEMKI